MERKVFNIIISSINTIITAYVSVLYFMMCVLNVLCMIVYQPFLMSMYGFSTNSEPMSRPLRGTNAFRSGAQNNYLRRAWPR